MRNTIVSWLLVLMIASAAGALSAAVVVKLSQPNDDDRIREFYLTENAVHVSPHSIRKQLTNGQLDVILVDLRSAKEYEHEHILGAINIPAYRDPDTPAYYDVERIVADFAKLPKDKNIVVYCYSMPCMTGRKIGKLLAEYDIYVKHLGIGWNEWRYFWTSWNHEHEWNTTNVLDYIASGKQSALSQVAQ